MSAILPATVPLFQQHVVHNGADIGHLATIVKRQAEEETQFVNVLNADPHQTFDFVLGPERHNYWGIQQFFSHLQRTVGFLIWGQIYNLFLASSTGYYREQLEALDFFFNSQLILTGAFFNLVGWFVYMIGRLAIAMYTYGPSYTFEKIRTSTTFAEAFEQVTDVTNAGINVWVYIVEGSSNLLGWLVIMAIAQYFAGVNNTDDQKKKRSFQRHNEDHVFEAIQNFKKKIPQLVQ